VQIDAGVPYAYVVGRAVGKSLRINRATKVIFPELAFEAGRVAHLPAVT
jgi:hypothetical protein